MTRISMAFMAFLVVLISSTAACGARVQPRVFPMDPGSARAIALPSPVISPNGVTFVLPDVEMAKTTSFRAEFFQCNSVGSSPDGTTVPSGAQIVDNSAAVWTLGVANQTLRNGVQVNTGLGTKLLWSSGSLYVLGQDGSWWVWRGTSWTTLGAGQPTPAVSAAGDPCVWNMDAPVQPGTTLLAAAVTGPGTARQIDLKTPAMRAAIDALPAGGTFVMSLVSIGDKGESGRSSVSNPFIPKLLVPPVIPPVVVPPVVPPVDPCAGGKITIQVVNWSRTVAIGKQGEVFYHLSHSRPIVQVQVLSGTQLLAQEFGSDADLRPSLGMQFSVPRTPGLYNLTVFAKDSSNCTNVTTAIRQFQVQ